MSNENGVNSKEVEQLYEKFKKDAEDFGYHLNPDEKFTKALVRSLIVNKKRYGYWACPCRLAEGVKEKDIDVICPCDYRDADLNEYGACYCGLYLSQEVINGRKEITSIPERRPTEGERKKTKSQSMPIEKTSFSLPVWRCKVCGYLCARSAPPEICPICKAKKERFEKFF